MSPSLEARFAGSRVSLTIHGARALALVDFALRHVTHESVAAIHGTHAADVLVDDEGGALRVTATRASLLQTPADLVTTTLAPRSDGELVEIVTRAVTYHLADRCRDAVLLHAGMIVSDDVAIVMPGHSGSGKSTLTAGAVCAGMTLATDELTAIALPLGSHSVLARGLTRAIHLKPGSVFLLDASEKRSEETPSAIRYEEGAFVHAEALGGGVHRGDARLGAVVFPKFANAGEAHVRQLPGAELARRLMAVFVNARNLAGHGFADVAEIARRVPGYELSYGSRADGEALLAGVRAEI